MFIDIMIEALSNLYESTDHPDYKRMAIKDALDEAYAQKKLMDYDLVKGQVHIVSLTTALELVNLGLYDEFGRDAKMFKKVGQSYTFDRFLSIARNSYLSDITTDMLRDGYDYLSDLWNDNETYGNNNPDGTFRYIYRSLSRDSIETIANVLHLRRLDLQDCVLTAHSDEDACCFENELADILDAIDDLERTYP